jgi:phosphate transport system substrate-binding protein
VNWPTGTGANGNAGVGSQIQQIPYTLGYVGSEWSDISKTSTGLVKNKAGEFVAPTPAAVTAALDAGLAANAFDERLRGSVTNMEGAESYPIAAVTWVLVHEQQADATKGKALAGFLWYALHEGQAQNEALSYSKMPPSLVTKAEALVNSMDSGGQPLR